MWIAAAELMDQTDAKHALEVIARASADLVVLNELPFGPWLADQDTQDLTAQSEFLAQQELGFQSLCQQTDVTVITTRARPSGAKLVNEAVTIANGQMTAVHQKARFPNEPGFYEQTWFRAERHEWLPFGIGQIRFGALICTELMFTHLACHYARQRCDVIVAPRCSGGLDTWMIAARMAALASGCYVVSSNRRGRVPSGQVFGGGGFIVAPGGDVLAVTSQEEPTAKTHLDPDRVRAAQSDYPCYLTLTQSEISDMR
jgi:N-carbamoylputrescine amidase